MAGPKSGRGRRAKGQSGEREFFAILNKHLPERLRIERDLAQSRDGGLDGSSAQVAIEVKRQERLRLSDWLAQARLGSNGSLPVVAYRQSREPWRCLVELTPVQLAALIRCSEEIGRMTAAIEQAAASLEQS